MYAVEPRYLELAYFELPLISKWKSGPCFNMKLWQQVTKQCRKKKKLLLRSNFSSFPHYFIYIFLTSGVKLHIHLLNVVVQFIILLTFSTLICRGTDISKCFSESLGIRDNESRLYMCRYQEIPQSRSTDFQRHQKKERWGTNNDKTNATYEPSDAQTM